MSSKNGTKVTIKHATSHTLILKVLAELGNCNPKPYQIKLTETLLFKSISLHPILFHQKLSENERNCLILAAKGKTIQQTAYLMSIKDSTVITLRKRMLGKLGCRSIAHAVFTGLSYGYFTHESISELQEKHKELLK